VSAECFSQHQTGFFTALKRGENALTGNRIEGSRGIATRNPSATAELRKTGAARVHYLHGAVEVRGYQHVRAMPCTIEEAFPGAQIVNKAPRRFTMRMEAGNWFAGLHKLMRPR